MDKPVLLVTGAGGFLGRFISEVAAEGDWSVHGVDVVPRERAPASKQYHQLRLPDDRFFDIVKNIRPVCCIHCAGGASVIESVNDPLADFAGGPLLTVHLLDAMRKNAAECRVLLLSSAAVYGNPVSLPIDETHAPAPISPYGFHKWQSELLCREFTEAFNLPTASVRIFSAYGPGLRRQVLWDISRQLLLEKGLKLRGTGNETRDFIHAADIARAVLTIAATAPLNGEVYNLASGRETSVRELAERLAALLAPSVRPSFDGAVPRGDPLRWQADLRKLERLGFKPEMSLEDGLKNYADWCRNELCRS